MRLEKGASVIIVIPSNQRREDVKYTKPRDDFRQRIVSTVITSRSRSKQFECIDPKLCRKRAYEYPLATNGIERNVLEYIELPCVVGSYPHREEYLRGEVDERDVAEHISKGGEISFELLDYPSTNTRRATNTTLVLLLK